MVNKKRSLLHQLNALVFKKWCDLVSSVTSNTQCCELNFLPLDMDVKRCFQLRLCSLVISLLLIIGGLVVSFIWPVLLKYILDSNMVLTPSSSTYDLWKKFPMKFPIDFYFFNWTNPQDIYNKSVKPRFTQLGPYRFYETKEKSNITWNNNGTVTFKHLKYWYYTTNNNGNIQDKVTTINPISLSAGYAARGWSYIVKKGMTVYVTHPIHVTRTVSQMLFEGYEDTLITLAQTLPFFSKNMLPPWDRFGWFYTRNGSVDYEGIFNMGTGLNSTTFGRLYSWNTWTQTPYYESNCGKVSGSAGEFFPPYPGKDSISLFSPDMCRTMILTYAGESTVGGITGNKYTAGTYMFDNGSIYPENTCYCNGECVPSGVVNVSTCRFGSPSFASLPHFYNADPYYINSVEGLEPDKRKHEFFITLEPTTGIPLEVNARLQVNLLMQPIDGISVYEDAPRVFFPMLWFEQKVTIPDAEIFKLKLLLNMPVICCATGIVLVFVGIIMCSCLIYKICTMNMCGRKKSKYVYAEQHIPLKLEHQGNLMKTT